MLKPLKMVFGMVLLLCAVPAFAQTVDTAWVRRYDGPANYEDQANDIAVDGSGNVYVTGTSADFESYDYATVKYNPTGTELWVRRYNGPGNSGDAASAIAIDSSGNSYVTGVSWGNGTDLDYATIKYYSNGDTAWVRRYNGPGNGIDYANAIAVDGSGNVYVTGVSYASLTGGDYATIKYYSNGDTAWVRRYNGPGNSYDEANAIAVDDSINVYVTGYSTGNGTGYDYATVKYYPNGGTAWVRRYNGLTNSHDYAEAITIDSSRNVYVTGYSGGSGPYGFPDYATIKYYPNGDTAWVRRYNGPGDSGDGAKDIAVDGSGNVYVTGHSYGSGTNNDYATIKYYPNGDTAWVRRYNGPGNFVDGANAISLDNSGNIYVTGYSVGSGTEWDYVTVKYNPNGDTVWVRRYNGPADSSDLAYAIAVDDSGNVYVTGESYGGSETGSDYCTIKYFPKSTDVKDETEGQEKPSEFALSQNYPNPFNPTTAIRFKVEGQRLKVPIPTTLKIYNVLGEVVRTLVNEKKLPGDYIVQWDGKNDKGEQLSSGVYFYELKVSDYTSAKKMVLLK